MGFLIILLVWSFCLPKKLFKEPTSTVVTSSEGFLLGARIADDGQWRFPEVDSIPNRFKQSVLLFEDEYFYQHPGFNPVSIFNAQVEDNEDVFMYPNPSSMGSVFIRVPYATKDFETIISLIDLSGKVLIQDRYDSDATVHELNYSNLPAGIYLVNVRSEALNQTKKLVIE